MGNAGYYCHSQGFQWYHPGYKGLTKQLVDNCRKFGVGINVWTVNTMDELEQLDLWECQGRDHQLPGSVQGLGGVQKSKA